MKYLIVQEWENTKGNHAGMRHMCDMLKCYYPEEYSIIVYSPIPQQRTGKTAIANFYYYRTHLILTAVRKKWYANKIKRLIRRLKPDDEVFLLEYLFPYVAQYDIARLIRARKTGIRIYALAHLVPSDILKHFYNDKVEIKKWIDAVDVIMTLGTSLSEFFINEIGIDKKKVSTGFHYVDNSYYHASANHKDNKRPTILAMGNMQRNYQLLGSIIEQIPEINWIVCAGTHINLIKEHIHEQSNLEIKGFLKEEELRYLMSISSISLNVMNDTIGSNVVTTSMAMGMAMIVSDVGSIRDYCDETNAVFCENVTESFVNGIKSIINNEEKLKSMQLSAVKKSHSLSIQNVHCWFNGICGDIK